MAMEMLMLFIMAAVAADMLSWRNDNKKAKQTRRAKRLGISVSWLTLRENDPDKRTAFFRYFLLTRAARE